MAATRAIRVPLRCPVVQPTNRAPVQRLILAHGCASVAMAVPWPALLVVVWSNTHSDFWLGTVGAARMAPYVALSWLAGALGDRIPRIRLLRVSTWMRAGLLIAAAALLELGYAAAAVVVITLVVAVGTAAYPALIAEMPRIAGCRSERATRWLVTVEVSAFVIGGALGGLTVALLGPNGAVVLAAALGLAGGLLLVGIRVGRKSVSLLGTHGGARAGSVFRSGAAVRAIVAIAVINGVGGVVAVALLPMAHRVWGGGDQEFGWATAALGFGALGAPLLLHLVHDVHKTLLLCGLPLVATAATPGAHWALVPLVVLGASGAGFECRMTMVLQRDVPDSARAFALGLADTVMMSAALVGTGIAPFLASQLGPRGLFFSCAVAVLAVTRLAGRTGRPQE